MARKRKKVIEKELPEQTNDERYWPSDQKTISELIFHNRLLTISQRRNQLFEFKSKGYCAIMLNKDCMDLLSDGQIQFTLSNMLKYGSKKDDVNGSTFVFSKPGISTSEPILSHTRLDNNTIIILSNNNKVF